MLLFNIYKEFKIWLKIRRIGIENSKVLSEKGFRLDWIGRIYTVINIPDEVLTSAVTDESYVYLKIQELSPVFLDIGIADYITPEISKIPNTGAYLLVISPDRNYFRLWEIIKFFSKTFLVLLLARILYLWATSEPIISFFNNLINIIVNGN
tara:strand:+ start:11817 stop:12272 length:456 start_codon:yes stop_codon:yes gene_type:complete